MPTIILKVMNGELTSHITGGSEGMRFLLFLLFTIVGFTQGNADAFGRERVANPYTEGDYNFVSSISLEDWSTAVIGSATITLDSTGSMAVLTVTTDNDVAKLQTNTYHKYEAGKGQEVTLSLVVGEPTTGVTKAWGYFDDFNGLYFKLDGSELSVCSRSFTTGTTSDNCITNFNGGVEARNLLPKIDYSKNGIYGIDFQWLGSGVVRYYLYNSEGQAVLLHTDYNPGKEAYPYMQSGNLPVCFETSMSGGIGVGASIKPICAAVVASGGEEPPSTERAVGTTSIYTTTAATEAVVIAIRLKELFNNEPNRVIVLPRKFSVSAADQPVIFRFQKNPVITGGTWIDVPDENNTPVVEYSTDALFTSTGSYIAAPTTLFAATGGFGNFTSVSPAADSVGLRKLRISRRDFGTNSDTIVITVQRLTASNTGVMASLEWSEIR